MVGAQVLLQLLPLVHYSIRLVARRRHDVPGGGNVQWLPGMQHGEAVVCVRHDLSVRCPCALWQAYEWLKYGNEANHYLATTDGT